MSTDRRSRPWVMPALGAIVGAGFGSALGVAFGQLVLGLAAGVAAGAGIAILIRRSAGDLA